MFFYSSKKVLLSQNMFAEAHFPRELDKTNLDEYLVNGWFRMGQAIFTTNFLCLNATFYSSIWLRVNLVQWQKDKKFSKLQKLNSRFKTTIQPASITPEKEELYQKYKGGISFTPSASLQSLMYGEVAYSIFDTYEILLHEEEKLIAVGFFDLGDKSAAGITCFYDPEYKKHSLGKYLIYQKMVFCQENGFEWFYPGYFVPNCSHFDYKTEIGRSDLSFLHYKSDQWLEIEEYTPEKDHVLAVIKEKLEVMKGALEKFDVICELNWYEFFEVNLYKNFEGHELFDYPLFLYCLEKEENLVNPILTYDIRQDAYLLYQCGSIWSNPTPSANTQFYSDQLLREVKILYASSDPFEMAAILKSAVRKCESK